VKISGVAPPAEDAPAVPPGRQADRIRVALRRVATEYGIFPNSVKPLRTAAQASSAKETPWGKNGRTVGLGQRAFGQDHFTEEMEILYFPGCYPVTTPDEKGRHGHGQDPQQRAGIDFGILGAKENCCGESIRKTGDEELFKRLAKENIKTFIDNGVKKSWSLPPLLPHL
jgi:Fe-S oxidoreductase